MSKGKRRRQLYETDHFTQLLSQYEHMAIHRVKWKNLPDSMPGYIPEKWLVNQGQCVVFRLPGTENEIAILPVAYGSVKLDIYGNPEKWKAYAVGSSAQAEIINNLELDATNSVLIWNNDDRTGDMYYIETIVRKMVAIDKTLDINCAVQRTPIAIKTDKNNRLTAENACKEFSDGNQFIFDSGFDVQKNIEVVTLNVNFLGAELSDQYETYHDRILRYLGIDFLPVEKQERLITGEASANDNETLIRRELFMSYRESACKKINELFNINVEVEYVEPESVTDTSAMPGAPGSDSKTDGPGEGS